MSESDIMTHLISFTDSAVAKNINWKDTEKIRVVPNMSNIFLSVVTFDLTDWRIKVYII